MASRGDVVEALAREGGPEAAGLITRLMEHSDRELASIEHSLHAAAERERDEWKARALEAEARLFRVQNRMMAILEID